MRASAVAEKAGIPTVSIVLTGFLEQGQAIAQAQGIKNLAIAEYPGVIMTESKEELHKKVEEVLINNIVEGLTRPIEEAEKPVEPEPGDIVFKGTLDEVNELFYDRRWTDGLPIIPPHQSEG